MAYGAAAWLGASGFLAAYVAGVLVRARLPRHRRIIRSFHEGLATGAQIGLFLLLGLLVFPSRLDEVAVEGLVIAVVLLLIARPVAVFVCTVWFHRPWPETAFTMWAGLRGAVPIVLATFPLTERYPDGEFIFDVVFFVVLVSAVAQGLTLAPFARRLRLRATARDAADLVDAVPIDSLLEEVVELRVDEDSPVAGRALRDAPTPAGTRLAAIARGNAVLVPDGSTEILVGDVLIGVVGRDESHRLGDWLRGRDADVRVDAGSATDTVG
jgi:cell volume regulation protein A